MTNKMVVGVEVAGGNVAEAEEGVLLAGVPHPEVEVVLAEVVKVTFVSIVGAMATHLLTVRRSVACVVTPGISLLLAG
jgi:DNA mismatch repair ATPase MutS